MLAAQLPRAARASIRTLNLGAVLLCLGMAGCPGRRAKGPDWVLSAPASAVAAVSFRADWVLPARAKGDLLAGYPEAGAALAAFLAKTHLEGRGETGRITVYLPMPPAGAGTSPARSEFLIQLGGFRDPGRLLVAVADAFPTEGFLPLDRRDLPLYVVLDRPTCHLRATADGDGRVWLGDLNALARLGSEARRDPSGLASAVTWISGEAPIQGFLRLSDTGKELASGLPARAGAPSPGLRALAWGVSPGAHPDALMGFELAFAGGRDAVQKTAPWLQRFLDAVQGSVLPGVPAPTPEVLQEDRRIGVRCQLTRQQLDFAMARLELPCCARSR